MMIHCLHVAGNLPVKTLVARQLRTNVSVDNLCGFNVPTVPESSSMGPFQIPQEG